MDSQNDSLLQKLCEALTEARKNGKLHVDLEEFHKQQGELDLNTTLEVLKKGIQIGIIGIDNKQIRPTPLGIELCKLDKSLYS
jgi:flagellar motor component MotA